MTLLSEAQYLKGVGPRVAVLFKKLKIHTVEDLVFRFPKRYEDRRNLPRIRDVRPGDQATIRGRLISVDTRQTRRSMVLLRGVVNDGTGSIALTWFNQPWLARKLKEQMGEVIAYGTVKVGSNGLEMPSPEFELIDSESDAEDFTKIVPVYGLTEGLGQGPMRRAVRSALSAVTDELSDPLPKPFRDQYKLLDFRTAIEQVHFPSELDLLESAKTRLIFEEFLYLQLGLWMKRAEVHADVGVRFPVDELIQGLPLEAEKKVPPTVKKGKKPKASPAEAVNETLPTEVGDADPHLFVHEDVAKYQGEALWDQIHRIVPFDLTGAQKRTLSEIFADMGSPHPMNRLVQGDVGSGKTVVAACAMLVAIRAGYQAAIMAPTEILAEQHQANLRRLFEPLGIEVSLATGRLGSKESKRVKQRLLSGEDKLVVGTHALIEPDVVFRRLGLVVVDEQHRFGVLQRAALRDKGEVTPDVLVMTATPIPRTLAMTVHGDLDVSVIDEMPPGRKPITTHLKPTRDRPEVYEAIKRLLAQGRQAYVVCPMVSESEVMLAQAAEELYEQLRTQEFSEYRVGLLHGRLKSAEKDAVMESFRNHETDVLVSTTVVEVGVDVPNATVMVVEDATRFGLAQLHQLRGRVGRGEHKSYCVLVGDAKNEDSQIRLDTLRDTQDGFKIAEVDLRLRKSGDLAGTRQSGASDFRIADIVRDSKLLELARQAAKKVIDEDPKLAQREWAAVLQKVTESRRETALVAIS